MGDLVVIEKNQRVPADCVLLKTSDSSGSCFVRTDQLDGETDWKLRIAIESTQSLPEEAALFNLDAEIYGKLPFTSDSGESKLTRSRQPIHLRKIFILSWVLSPYAIHQFPMFLPSTLKKVP